ncbi:MAG TPA: hypothetical protein VFY06_01995 [Verrucomicrobiae bacterium]|nr:hypothetical protein [Verrucomicrobiae bacterium]
MKTRNISKPLLATAVFTILMFAAGNMAAQEPTASSEPVVAIQPASTSQPAAAVQPAPQLSYGVPQVLQLVEAKVSDNIIVTYIQNSGTIYSLSPGEIVYLKQQGASDAVLNAMMNQRNRVLGSTETAAAPANSSASASPASTGNQAAAPAPPVAYVPAQSSTVYVIPDTQTYRYNAWYYGATPYYYYPYPYYNWPAVSLSFGWGSYNYSGGGYHGGYYGGSWHGGGGYHGGGGWHGGGGGPPPGGGGGHPPGGGGGHH